MKFQQPGLRRIVRTASGADHRRRQPAVCRHELQPPHHGAGVGTQPRAEGPSPVPSAGTALPGRSGSPPPAAPPPPASMFAPLPAPASPPRTDPRPSPAAMGRPLPRSVTCGRRTNACRPGWFPRAPSARRGWSSDGVEERQRWPREPVPLRGPYRIAQAPQAHLGRARRHFPRAAAAWAGLIRLPFGVLFVGTAPLRSRESAAVVSSPQQAAIRPGGQSRRSFFPLA